MFGQMLTALDIRSLEGFFLTPVVDTLVVAPILILVQLLNKKIVTNLLNGKIEKKILEYRFHFGSIILIGSLYSLYVTILTIPVFASQMSPEPSAYTITIFIINISSLVTLPFWYKTGSKILKIFYIIYFIFLFYPIWFIYPYIYASFLALNKIWLFQSYNKSIKYKIIFFFVAFVLLGYGGAVYYFVEFIIPLGFF